ncbi:MAG: type II toxin-antitoxin system HicA family toxin [Gammaproteobacteria bacterium]|nr:type II toxin-antitoxin system HicA family toxin [Gammaproteobacteria bacterium]
MTRLPGISGRQAVQVFQRLGHEIDRQRGSHVHSLPPHRRLVVPNHRAVAKGTLRGLIREAGLAVNQFTELLK